MTEVTMAEQTALAQREQLVLSSVLFDAESKEWAVYTGMNTDIFEEPIVSRIIKAFNGVSEDGTMPTETLIIDQLCGSDTKGRDRWKLFFERLKSEVPPESKEALEKHLDVLRDANMVKKYGRIAEDVLSLVNSHNPFEANEEKNKIKNYIENAFFQLDEESTGVIKQMTLSQGIQYTIKSMKESLTSSNNENVTSGYEDLDKALDGGFKKGTFAMAAGRPGMGKTVWMLNSAIEAAKRGAKVLFISIEMSLLQCFQRLISKLADLSSNLIQQPEGMEPSDWVKLQTAAQEILKMNGDNFWVQEITEITVPQLERIIKHYKKKHDIDSVYIDYAQIMLTKDGDEPKEASDFAQISGGLRRACKNQNVAIIVGSQLNRDSEKRVDKKPMMADIRNSGAFEQDAARIIGLYRDEVYNEESEKPNILELIFLKNRFGKNGITLEYNYDLEKQAIFSQGESISA